MKIEPKGIMPFRARFRLCYRSKKAKSIGCGPLECVPFGGWCSSANPGCQKLRGYPQSTNREKTQNSQIIDSPTDVVQPQPKPRK